MNTQEFLQVLEAAISSGLDNTHMVVISEDLNNTMKDYFGIMDMDRDNQVKRGLYIYESGLSGWQYSFLEKVTETYKLDGDCIWFFGLD